VREKTYLYELGFDVTPFYPVHSEVDLQHGIEKLGLPCVIKTAGQGYDGKGQLEIEDISEVHSIWQRLNTPEAVLEKFIACEKEVSVIGARGHQGELAHFGVIENQHKNHILDTSRFPSSVSDALQQQAITIWERVIQEMNLVGTLCIEFFVTPDQQLLINELAPRPHNSGHFTIDACLTSQFEQHIRAICGLPLGSTACHHPAAMVNLLGDLWLQSEPNWVEILSDSNLKLHLYGKNKPRSGRKMGHLTVLADSPEEALEKALHIKDLLKHPALA
jgi:5-(carboxyamino)imidazole ribonucleotide synthase